MPYSFTQIEKDKSWRIGFVFFFLIFFYFLVSLIIYWSAKAYLLIEVERSRALEHTFLFHLSWHEVYSTLAIALVVGGLHWLISIYLIIPKVLSILRAQPLDPKDQYHIVFKNILDEVSIATGGIQFQGVVVATPALNAFALMDFSGNKIIGVTEGLLSKLNRSQLEAVVAHEAAHIATGDCLETTVTTSLFDVYQSILTTVEIAIKETRGRAIIPLMIGHGILQSAVFVSHLFRMFISREREYRADAIAVRLTRDPLSLAEALYSISRRWRGYGLPGGGLEAIFIVSPEYHSLDEKEGLMSDLFSTHPPVDKRLDILLDIAHSNMEYLEEKFKEIDILKQPAPESVTELLPQTSLPIVPLPIMPLPMVNQWRVYRNGQWEGPFGVPELIKMEWISHDTFVSKVGTNRVCLFFQDEDIKKYKENSIVHPSLVACPRCQVALAEDQYKGGVVLRCSNCSGILMKEDDVQKILIRDDYFFSEAVRTFGDRLTREINAGQIKRLDLKTANLFACPECRNANVRMLRSFYSLAYPIEIDRCSSCHSIWFDKTELEVLQYLVERHKKKPS